jgi:NAD(P)-dependent dehydrogenase (short-subunit alcohol dehydrogenase family)
MASLEGKVVVIAGGSSGIGAAAARLFARHGARVVLAARGAERGEALAAAIRDAGGDARFVRADLSRDADVAALMAETVRVHGRVDAAFNNAATTDGVYSQTAEFTEEQYDRAMAMNLKSVWLCMKHEILQMLKQDPPGGAIVNTSSLNGLGGAPGGALYSAAKAGVLGLTKSAAREYGSRGIRINALVAGAFRTPMLEEAIARAGGAPRKAFARSRHATSSSRRWRGSAGRKKRPRSRCGSARTRLPSSPDTR